MSSVAQTEFDRISSAILALFPPLPASEQRIALALYRLLATSGPVSHDALAAASEVRRTDVERVIARWPDVQRDNDHRITAYGGLTLAETKHRLRVGGNARYTWCAWDTLFLPALLSETVQVDSTCPATGKRIALTVGPDAVEAAGEVPYVSLIAPKRVEAQADIVGHFCCHVHFLADRQAGGQWMAKQPATYLATLEQAWHLGRRRNAQRYPMVHA